MADNDDHQGLVPIGMGMAGMIPGVPQTEQAPSRQQGPSLDEVIKLLAFGLGPQAPRIAEQYMTGSATMFGGYPKGYTNNLGQKKGTLNFATLRQVSERSPLLSAIVSTRLHQVQRFSRRSQGAKKGDVGFKVVHKRHADSKFKVPEEFNVFCREVEEFLMKPWKVYWSEGVVYDEIEPNMSGFLQKITEDLLVINRPCIELGLDPNRTPRAFGAIDGANVIPTFAAVKYISTVNREFPKDFATNYAAWKSTLGMIADKYQISVDEKTQYIYILQGRPTAAFRHDEIIVAPTMPTTDVTKAGYPRSMLERSIFTILAEILAMTANQRFFEFGNMAETIIGIRGQWNDKHITDFTNILATNMSGIAGMFRLPVVALPNGKDDLSVIPTRQNHRDMLFDVYIQKLTNLACAVFRMHPSEINEAPRAGDNRGSLNQASQATQIEMSQEQGLESCLQHYKTTVFDPILERIHPDLTMEWDYGQNEMESIQITTAKATFVTVNEMRQEQGLDPLPPEQGGDVVSNPIVAQALQAKQQMEMQKQQMQAQAAQPGAQGQAQGGDEGNDDGGDGGGGDDDGQQDDEEESNARGPQRRDESDDEFVQRIASLQRKKKA